MKIKLQFLFLLIPFTFFAQVGIGTQKPEADLHVKGNTIMQQKLELGSLPFVQVNDENFRLLTRTTSSNPVGKVGVLNVDNLKVAPVNVVNYKFTNIKLDNLRDVNLQYDSNKYIVALANFRYVGAPIKKVAVNNTFSVGAFVSRTFIDNNTWHLEIGNRFLDLAADKSLEYYVTLIIYDKSYYRNLPEIVTNLNGRNTGTASAVPNLY